MSNPHPNDCYTDNCLILNTLIKISGSIFGIITESLPCPGENWLRCVVGQQCVSPEKWCDYKVDCIDGSDEKNCSKYNYCAFFKIYLRI